MGTAGNYDELIPPGALLRPLLFAGDVFYGVFFFCFFFHQRGGLAFMFCRAWCLVYFAELKNFYNQLRLLVRKN